MRWLRWLRWKWSPHRTHRLCRAGTHAPFTLDGFRLCERCGEALRGFSVPFSTDADLQVNAPLGRPSLLVTHHELGWDWRRAIQEAKSERMRKR
jgi:hypothetical protein